MGKSHALFVNAHAFAPAQMKRGGYSYMPLAPEVERTVRAEMEEWVVQEYSTWRDENDDYDYVNTGSSTRDVPLSEMISASSGEYSSNDIRGDILVADGHFVGIILRTAGSYSGTWSRSEESMYSLLYTDGRVDGNAKASSSFSGESSSKDSDDYYSLKRKKK